MSLMLLHLSLKKDPWDYIGPTQTIKDNQLIAVRLIISAQCHLLWKFNILGCERL